MRVLLTSDTLGGVWTHTRELSSALAGRGHDVLLVALGAAADEAARGQLERAGVELLERPLRLEWMPSPWRDLERTRQLLLELSARRRFDVAHLCSFGGGALPWSLPTLLAAHSDVLGWWRAVHGEPAPSAWGRYARWVGQALRAAELVVTPTRTLLRGLERDYGPLPRTRVIWNGRSPAPPDAARKRPFVLAAGRMWDEAKNLRSLDAVAATSPWPVLVAGPARTPDGELVAMQHARCLGTLAPERVRRWMTRAAIYAHPARYEPFGLAVLEAALAGCALVLGDLPSLRELWQDAAVFVEPDDVRGLERVLRRLRERPEVRARLARRARERAGRYSLQRMVLAYEGTYGELSGALASLVEREERA